MFSQPNEYSLWLPYNNIILPNTLNYNSQNAQRFALNFVILYMRNCRLCKVTNFGIRHLVFFVHFLVLTSAKHLWYNKTTRARVDNYSTVARICQAFFKKTCHASQTFIKTQNAWLFLLFCNYYNSFTSFCQLFSSSFFTFSEKTLFMAVSPQP